MGFGQNDFTKKTYVSIIGGKFAVRVDEKTPNAIKRFSEKLKKDVWELQYPDFTGRILDLRIDGSQFGDQLTIVMDDVGDRYHFQIPVESRYFSAFCNKIENCDLTKEIKMQPYDFESKTETNPKTGNAKKIVGMNLYQFAEKIPPFYSKENPKNKPQLAEKYTDAQLKIFFIQQTEFFKEMIGVLRNTIVTESDVKREMVVASVNEPIENDAPIQDDLPFANMYYRVVPFFLRKRNELCRTTNF